MMKPAKFILLLYATILAACGKVSDRYEPRTMSGVVWGTTYSITYNGSEAGDAVLDAMNSVGKLANAYDPTSEIARLNADGDLDFASDRFISLVESARRLSSMTGGAFDPTIGPVVDLWGFGAGSTGNDTVNDAEVTRRLALAGMDGVVVHDNTVILTRPGSRLDFAAFAKGYGVDRVADALDDAAITDYLVEIGGEIRAKGKNPQGQPWRIQIDAPIPDSAGRHERLTVLELTDMAVATSGNYRNFRRTADGHLVGHTISPFTGLPAETDLLSVTIVANDAMTADAVATACMVLGSTDAADMIRRLCDDPSTGVRGALLVSTGTDRHPYHITQINTADIIR